MYDIDSILHDPDLKKWLDSCPTVWNIEYSEEWGQLCLFVCPSGQSNGEFLEQFKV